jgi:hypothetical protein
MPENYIELKDAREPVDKFAFLPISIRTPIPEGCKYDDLVADMEAVIQRHLPDLPYEIVLHEHNHDEPVQPCVEKILRAQVVDEKAGVIVIENRDVNGEILAATREQMDVAISCEKARIISEIKLIGEDIGGG